MVLELIIIGGAIYYYCRKNKEKKAKQAAWAAGQPWRNRDGSLVYPPNFPQLPPYTQGDYKRQIPLEGQRREFYTDFPSPQAPAPLQEKPQTKVEVREFSAPANEKL